jgi:poly-gamma-glutamate capsule biosynthesis protein CapA/YwtB (metallophosphatase superfamily)
MRIKFFSAYLIILFLIVSCNDVRKNESSSALSTDSSKTESKKIDTLTVIGVGDIMMGTNFPSNALPPNDGKNIFDDVSETLSSADVTFGNLEGPLLSKGGSPKNCPEGSHCVAFRMPVHYAAYLKNAGFDIVSIANNHANDMGEEGRKSTKESLSQNDIGFSGQKDCETYSFEKNGIRFGLAAFAYTNNTTNFNNYTKAKEIIKTLKSISDVLIVSFHGGAEGLSAQRVPGSREFYLGEDRGNVLEFAHLAVEAGADIVFGHGPHVPRAVELFNGRFICYSLGNFCTYAKFGLSGALGYCPILKVFVNKKGEFLKAEIISVKQIKRGIPVLDENKSVVKLIRKLTNQDFPDSKLQISDDGIVTSSIIK